MQLVELLVFILTLPSAKAEGILNEIIFNI